MKFILTVKNKSQGEPWEEHHNRPNIETIDKAENWGKYIVEFYNGGLRPGEVEREFVSVIEGGDAKVPSHLCRECDASGLLKPECPECGGDGWVYDPKEEDNITCPVCHAARCPHCE